MLARVADSLYWMSRYLERVEFSARLVGLQLQRLPVSSAGEIAQGWSLVFRCLGAQPPGAESFGEAEDDDYLFADGYALTDFLTFEASNPSSILASLHGARDNARQVRDCLSAALWTCLNRTYLSLRGTTLVDEWTKEPERFYAGIVEGVQQFDGICQGTLRRGDHWCFMQLGKYVERAQLAATTLLAHCGDPFSSETGSDGEHWTNALRACNALEAYGRTHGGDVNGSDALTLLVCDPAQPHSLGFAAERLWESLEEVDPLLSDRPRATPFAVLDRISGLLSGCADAPTAVQQRHLAEILALYQKFHGLLEQEYVYYPVHV